MYPEEKIGVEDLVVHNRGASFLGQERADRLTPASDLACTQSNYRHNRNNPDS
jgi:hypothetical protein